ncbi:MAG: hypothetical protein MUP63_00660 [Candidatus Nanohaloarchaeota archaeon QJJ-7]|nr:hypothetical protein [Candidatus Nanohaloarchaeota archaeon QJJ-7]
MEWGRMKKDWRIWFLILSLLVSFLLIFNPTNPYTKNENGDVVLNTNIKQGLDLQGGARVLIKPQPEEGDVTSQDVDQIIDTLRTRISAFGLQEMEIRPVDVAGETHIQIELAGAETSDLQELINRTGRFEARIPFTVQDGDSISLGDQQYATELDGDTLIVDGETVELGGTFNVSRGPENIQFTYTNRTDEGAFISPLAFSGQDMLGVDISSQASGFQQTEDGWQFQFQVSITETAAERVQDIAQNMDRGSRYLLDPATQQNTKLVLYLDQERISGLNIRNTFQDSLVQQPVITGGESTRGEAVTEMNKLKSVLQSGALPMPIKIKQTTRVSPTLGKQFLQSAILAIIVAILSVALVIFIRYRDPKIVIPLSLTGFSELIMIFGFAAAVGWTIDIPSIAGIIAAIGTGVDDQVIITDERGKRTRMSFKKRFKRAFFIIFTSAASTIGAMLPLTQIGAGTITGFAVTTIVGILIGVGITRPAYARVLQYME